MANINMPTLGAYMDKATVLEWFVAPGDTVTRGQPVALVETDKASIEVECFVEGAVERLIADIGQVIKVGDVLAVVTEPAPTADYPPPLWGELHATPLARSRAQALEVDLTQVDGTGPGGAIVVADVLGHLHDSSETPKAPLPPRLMPHASQVLVLPEIQPMPHVGSGATRSLVSPLARRRAHELGVHLHGLEATHPDGAIHARDVEDAHLRNSHPVTPPKGATSAPASPKPQTPSGHGGMRGVIAAAMSRAKREIPHYYLQSTIPMDRAINWMKARNKDRPVTERILPAAMLLRAVALAAAKYPETNGHYSDGEFRGSESVHLGNAINLRKGGLVVPALLDAQAKDLDELMANLKDLTTRAKKGRLKRAELTDATITVTSLGDRGAEVVYGVIYPPQVAIVGFGRVHERPWVADGALAARQVVIATLSADHRVSDGHLGGQFLWEINKRLQEPELL